MRPKIIFTFPAVYSPHIRRNGECVFLRSLDDNPLCGVYVHDRRNAAKFADIESGIDDLDEVDELVAA